MASERALVLAGVVELVDTQDLKSCSEFRSAGSIPAARTIESKVKLLAAIYA